jgi:hypothetical protein
VAGKDSFIVYRDLMVSSAPLTCFAHVLENGKIKMYDFSLLFSAGNNKLGKSEDAYYFVEKDGKIYKINKIGWMYNFRKIMNEILADYPELEKMYIKKAKLTVANLRYIIENYNTHFKTIAPLAN